MASAATEPAIATTAELPIPASLAPEFRLLLCCCSEKSGAVDEAQILGLPSEATGWKRFLGLLETHGVLPIVQRKLLNAKDLIPDDVLTELQARRVEHVRRALWLTQLLKQVTGALHGAGIRVLPYKGPVLAWRLYGDVAMRQYSDLDLLVGPRDLVRAKAELSKLGLVPHTDLRPMEERALLASGYELTFDGPGNRNLVEIQWQVLPRFYAIDCDASEFFSRAQSVHLDSGAVQTLGDEDLVLALCVHAAKHAWAKLSWVYDIARLSSMPGIHWELVRDSAERLGTTRIVGITFFLAHKLLGSDIPPAVEPLVVGDPQVTMLGNEIVQHMCLGAELDPESFAYFRLMLRTRERVRDRMRFVWRLITTPTISEWSMIRLPEWLFPLYRVVRILRLVGRLTSSGKEPFFAN